MKRELTNKEVNSNILKYYIYRTLYGAMFANAIFTVFMLSKGLSYSQIALTESVFGLAMLIEIFGGALADLIGRKIAVFLYTLIVGISSIVFGLSTNFWTFTLANALWGVGIGVGAGADTALVYDSLKSVGRKQEFIKIHSRGRTFSLITGMFGVLVGTYLYTINEKLPFFISAIFYVLSGTIFLSTHEQKIKKKYNFYNHYKNIKDGLKHIIFNKNLRWIVLFGMLAIFYNGFFGIIQSPYILNAGFEIKDLGWIIAVTIAIEALFAYSAEHIHNLFSEKTCFTLMLISQIGSSAGLAYAFGPKILVFLLLLKFSAGFGFTFAEHYLQKHAESRIRASTSAAEGFILDLVMVFTLPLLGLLTDTYSLHVSLLIISTILTILGTILIMIFPKHKHRLEW